MTKKASAAAKKTGRAVAKGSPRAWEILRKKLLAMRDDLMETVRKKQELETAGPEVGDEADQATSSLEKEMLFELNDNERNTLDQIEATLRKMEKGVYGLCESCQKPILKARLHAVPFARYCIECQSSNETAVV